MLDEIPYLHRSSQILLTVSETTFAKVVPATVAAALSIFDTKVAISLFWAMILDFFSSIFDANSGYVRLTPLPPPPPMVLVAVLVAVIV